ncbi:MULTISPECIES: SGNH/GDSL hydrolase family protein [unclassified Brevundimonas]|uniref:SGNH/GDSL hydrolase family protein n=1 Tax=unclassified Brevundimonas TaxID=2622653 RepID=UPI0025BDCFA4|nr:MULTISPECIES: SGNH/GDSL hydrolase family protein [unclassified Brevundimonas]
MATLGRRALAGALGLSLMAAGPAVAAQERWVAAYAFAPSSAGGPTGPASAPNPRDMRGPLGPDVVEGVTLSHVVTVTASGQRLRLRLSNAYGAEPITLGAVTVHLGDMTREVRFNGERSSIMPAGAPLVSDPVDLAVAALDQVKVSIALPRATRLPTHRWRQTMRDADGVESAPMRLGVLLAGIEVESATPPGVIVAFGDSITEGTGALPDGPGGWPERLAARLVEAGRPWAVINAGIGGNRLLHQGSGPSGLERLDADALVPTGARCLILLEGVNDIGRPSRPQYAHQAVSAADLIAGYRQVIRRAHAAGLKVVLATVPPFEGANYFTPEGEAGRQAVNAWLRAQTEADGVVDFDAALRDPVAPSRLQATFHSGDWLHPSDAGYQAMAEAIPLDACD